MSDLIKACPICNTEFVDKTISHNKICCSKKCVNRLWLINNRERNRRTARALREKRRDITKKRALEGRSTCSDCGKTLNRNNKCGFCKTCRYNHNKWYSENKDRRRQYEKDYYNIPENREKLNKRVRDRLHNDLNYKLRTSLRCRLKEAVKNNQKGGSAVDDLGCSIEEFRIYIESRFQEGMTWENWGVRGWHMDHIRPLVSFDLSDPEQFKKACHYTNIQPLWAEDNLKKNDSYQPDAGESL